MSLHGAGDLSGVSGGRHANLAFSLSKLLREKMANHGFVPGLKGGHGMSMTGKGKGGRAGGDLSAASFLVKRCPPATLARLDEEHGCFWWAPFRLCAALVLMELALAAANYDPKPRPVTATTKTTGERYASRICATTSSARRSSISSLKTRAISSRTN